MAKSISWTVPSVLAITLALGAMNSEARPIRVDAGGEFNIASGGLWDTTVYPDLTASSAQSTAAVSLGFTIDFGTGPVDTLFINENGFVTFGAAADFAVGGLPAGTNFIAPLYADLQSLPPTDPAPSVPFQDAGQISYSTGVVKQVPDADGFYSPDGAQPAFRATWWAVADGAETVTAQLVLIHVADATDPNAFDVELNYGFESGNTPTLTAPGSGLVLGSNTFAYTGPFTDPGDQTMSFRNGVLTSGGSTPPTQVPEPSALSMLLLGLGIVLWRQWAGRDQLLRRAPSATR